MNFSVSHTTAKLHLRFAWLFCTLVPVVCGYVDVRKIFYSWRVTIVTYLDVYFVEITRVVSTHRKLKQIYNVCLPSSESVNDFISVGGNCSFFPLSRTVSFLNAVSRKAELELFAESAFVTCLTEEFWCICRAPNDLYIQCNFPNLLKIHR